VHVQESIEINVVQKRYDVRRLLDVEVDGQYTIKAFQ
jgi:hypothetical protein